jgi:hypothetical protein
MIEPMRYRDIDAVSRLIDQRIPENSTLEYKSELSLGTQGEKKELLKDLTSMGNGGGGTLIFGMEEVPGTSIAKALTPLTDRGLVGVVEDVVTSAVRPPPLSSFETYEFDGGFVLVVDVERSPLGPYMVDAYGDQRYHKRAGNHTHQMSEREVRDAYELAHRSLARRDELWKQHLLPMKVDEGAPWLVVSALPEESLTEIFDSRKIDLSVFQSPTSMANYISHTGLQFALGRLRHWTDGLAADDGANGIDPRLMLRLHRDGSGGIAQQVPAEINQEWNARVLNAFLIYLAWFWAEFNLQQAVEVELAIVNLVGATIPANAFTVAPTSVVVPRGVDVNHVSVSEYALPWELARASVRHRLLRRFSDRVEQTFGRDGARTLFERGWLLDRHGSITGMALDRGMIWQPNQGQGGLSKASVDTAGQVYGNEGVCGYIINGAFIDADGNTLACLEMAQGPGCPDDFVPRIAQGMDVPPTPGRDPMEVIGEVVRPEPTGGWSDQSISDLLI